MTILAQLYLNEPAKLDFGIEISGSDDKLSDARFIIEGPDFGIVCDCMETAGVITANVPKLTGILPAGTYHSRLEVIIDGKHFQPLTEDIKFNQPIAVNATSSTRNKSENINLRATNVKVRVANETVSVQPLSREEVKQKSFSNYVGKVLETDDKESRKAELLEKINTLKKELAKNKR